MTTLVPTNPNIDAHANAELERLLVKQNDISQHNHALIRSIFGKMKAGGYRSREIVRVFSHPTYLSKFIEET